MPIRVVHIITGLQQGGAEVLLRDMVLCATQHGQSHEVISLRPGGKINEQLVQHSVTTHDVGMERFKDAPRGVARLISLLRQLQPDVVHTWLYHADLLGGIAARLAAVPHVVWGLHNERLPDGAKSSTRLIHAVCCRLANRVPDHIISCSISGAKHHVERGYPANRIQVIENGVDITKFIDRSENRMSARRAWGFNADDYVIGLSGRVSPEKGHREFLQACGRLRDWIPNLRLALCGRGAEPNAEPLSSWLRHDGLQDVTRLLGEVEDMPAWYAAVDLVCSASSSEAMSLTLLEALACRRTVVSTNVGDAARLLADIGRVVPPNNPDALFEALRVTALEPKCAQIARRDRGRERVQQNYSLKKCLDAYFEFYEEIALA